MLKKIFAITAAVGLSASYASAGQLPVLIIVDNTDPANVTFNATGAAAAVVDSSATIISGMTLLDLFGGAGVPLASTTIGGDLSPSGNPGAYNRVLNNFGSLTDNDLNFWASGVGGGQSFNTVDPAFTGSTSSLDFSGASFNLSGDIIIGDTSGGSGAVLGTWEVVPTPGAVGLFAMAGLAASRRRRA